jgi:hypothetical protein
MSRQPMKFESLKLFDYFVRQQGLDLRDDDARARFVRAIDESVAALVKNGALLHGHRTEAMFAYVVAALGHFVAMRSEDDGDVFLPPAVAACRAPDYRIVLPTGRVLLVEAKNCGVDPASSSFEMKVAYADSLRHYARLFGGDLYVAIYWRRASMWTLVSLDRLGPVGAQDVIAIDFPTALMSNEMGLVGDQVIGTAPPIHFRLLPQERGYRPPSDGRVKFTVERTEIVAAGVVVTDPREEQIAWQLVMFGRWPMGAPAAEVDEHGFLSAVEYTVAPDLPEDVPLDQDFHMIGSLSQIITAKYLLTTGTDDAAPARLRPARVPPDQLALTIPEGYSGGALKLWRFTQVVAPLVAPDPERS